jgi:hypothetical protein
MMMMLLFLLLFRVLLLSESCCSCRLMLNTEYTYTPTDYICRTQQRDAVRTDMTCRPTAEPLMACAEGVVLDHPAPLAE